MPAFFAAFRAFAFWSGCATMGKRKIIHETGRMKRIDYGRTEE